MDLNENIDDQNLPGEVIPSANGEIGDPPTPQGDPPAAPKSGGGVEKRIGELTREKREAERDAAYWRGVAEGATRTAPVAPGITQEPEADQELNPNDFNSDAEYLKAVAKKVRDDTIASIKSEMSKNQKADVQSVTTTVIKAARAKYTDFDEVALNKSVPITQEMYDASMGENLGEILYHLGKNPTEATRIASLSPIQQAKEIGKIEVIISTKPPTKSITNAPAPPKTITGGPSPITKKDSEMTRKELHAKWDADRKKAAGIR